MRVAGIAGAIVDNPAMRPSLDWHPILPAHMLDAGVRLVATRVLGQDLVAWRSSAGVAQVWHDRCPHRGVHLSLGRLIDGRLSCAYHGWEFAPDTGRCEVIPALADLARVPGQVGARTCAATEAQQMVWVRLESDPRAPASAAPADLQTDTRPGAFLCSLGIRAGIGAVHDLLQARGFAPGGPAAWRGLLADQPLRLFSHPAQSDLSFLHAWLQEPAGAVPYTPVFAALRRLRSEAESAAAGAHAPAP